MLCGELRIAGRRLPQATLIYKARSTSYQLKVPYMANFNNLVTCLALVLRIRSRATRDILASGPDFGRINWVAPFDIVKKRFPKEYADGVFKFDAIAPPPTTVSKADNAKAVKLLGPEFKSYEEQIVSVVEHYLKLIGRK